jgi:hypothetical protein
MLLEPVLVGLDGERSHQSQATLAIGENAHDMGATSNLLIDALQPIRERSAAGRGAPSALDPSTVGGWADPAFSFNPSDVDHSAHAQASRQRSLKRQAFQLWTLAYSGLSPVVVA